MKEEMSFQKHVFKIVLGACTLNTLCFEMKKNMMVVVMNWNWFWNKIHSQKGLSAEADLRFLLKLIPS